MKQAPEQPYYAPARFPLKGGVEGGGGFYESSNDQSKFWLEIKTNDDQNIQTKHNELKTGQISQSSRSTLTTVSHGNGITPHMLQLYTTGLGTSKKICLIRLQTKTNYSGDDSSTSGCLLNRCMCVLLKIRRISLCTLHHIEGK